MCKSVPQDTTEIPQLGNVFHATVLVALVLQSKYVLHVYKVST